MLEICFFNYVFKYSHPIFSISRNSKMKSEAISLEYEQDTEKRLESEKIYTSIFIEMAIQLLI